MNKPIYILGSGLSHDGSTCLMKNGKIVVGIEKERLTRKKHDGFNDNLTIDYCLKSEGISFEDIDLIVQENTCNPECKPEEIEKRSGRNIPSTIPQITISHHLAHAYSALGTSPFTDMSILVIDGQGSSFNNCLDIDAPNLFPDINKLHNKDKYWEFLSCYSFKKGKLTPVWKNFGLFHIWDRNKFPMAPEDMQNSIGEFYDGVSNYIFNRSFCEGKTMGLAPFGREGIYNFDAFDFDKGVVKLKQNWIKYFDLLKSGKYIGFSENFQYFADIAKWAQQQLEKVIIECFAYVHKIAPCENISYAGGVALNAVVNSKLLSNTSFKNIYIQPASGDNGLAIGCCYYGWLEYFKKERVMHDGSTYFGKSYNNSDVFADLKDYSGVLNFSQDKNYIKKTAQLLNEGKVVAWFQKGSEFGPRALGHRSILANPTRKDIKNFINRQIKHREDFRPFAPSVLKKDLHKYFRCDFDESDYMLKVAEVKSHIASIIPGVVHKDLSARVQTVDEKLTPEYYQLIYEFKNYSGIPILLNTSFNGANMPVIETPEEAIKFFIDIKYLDALVVNNIIIDFKVGGKDAK